MTDNTTNVDEGFDFFLVIQHVRQGTVTPTRNRNSQRFRIPYR